MLIRTQFTSLFQFFCELLSNFQKGSKISFKESSRHEWVKTAPYGVKEGAPLYVQKEGQLGVEKW